MDSESPIIVALDGLNKTAALKLAEELRGLVWGFKVNDLFFEHGAQILKDLKVYGNVMCDGKFHDIPNTLKNTLGKLNGLADIFTVHASGGKAMVEAAVKAAPGKIAAVTVLTSLDDEACGQIYANISGDQVVWFAGKVHEWGANHMVCSGRELGLVSTVPITKIVPGIRPNWYSQKDDQRRVMTPAIAIERGADLLVIGRPIVKADDPADAAKRTLEEIQKAAEKA